MNVKKLKFVYPKSFNKKWEKIHLTDKDKKDMESQITEFESRKTDGTTFLGSVIRQTGGAIKWRFSSEESPKGKSGSNRVIYFVYANRTYFFLDIYAKGNKETLSDSEKKEIKKFISEFKKELNS